MNNIEHLNAKYVSLLEMAKTLRAVTDKVAIEQRKGNVSSIDKMKKSLELLQVIFSQGAYQMFTVMTDSIALGKQYILCDEAIRLYKESLLKGVKDISIVVRRVSDAQRLFNQLKSEYMENYGCDVNSAEAVNSILSVCTQSAITSVQGEIEKLQRDAKEILDKDNAIELSLSETVYPTDILPEEVTIARSPMGKTTLPLVNAVGVTNTYRNLVAAIRNQGNIMIDAAYESLTDDAIDDFILAYVFKIIESFPLGSVNIHIFNQNASYLYKRLANSFQGEQSGEVTKRVVQIHTDIKDLEKLRDVTCEDIFRKTSVANPDLYSVYESDRSDPFNFILMRDGLVDGSGYVSTETLDVVKSLSKPGDIGHKCGLRFLIIDNSRSFDRNLTPNAKLLLSQIKQNCGTHINYTNGAFSSSNERLEVLHISGNLEQYVQQRAEMLANAINSKEQNLITVGEVASKQSPEALGSIMYIPVGKSGNTIVELPLSCKDERGTVAGQCIGYMAIGQSGSGKSSFFHSLVLNGCMKYSPKDLQFWLLDFKNGGASSKYSKSGLPHIRMIAENNKIDDALCLFQMVLEEMERRSKAFNKNFADNIVDYNRIANEKGLEYFPRTIIAIDEVQEIFREDSASVLQKLISSIATRMRSAGMHFVMVAQNLSDGKSYMLKDAFLPSATGRICFRVATDIPRDSGFDDDFIQRRQEIAELKTGEAYVSYGKDTIKKVKMAFTSPDEMERSYFAEIRNRYPEYSDMKPLVIGSKKRLSVKSTLQGRSTTYGDTIRSIRPRKGVCTAIVGEDAYRMSPLEMHFSQHENSSVMFLGSDKQIASSLCASVACSLSRQNTEVHMFNGDRTRIQEDYDTVQHAFMYVCQQIGSYSGMMKNHRLNELKDVLKMIYSEFLKRQAMVQMADDEDPEFSPLFLIINDLFALESFAANEMVENSDDGMNTASSTGGFDFLNFGDGNDIFSGNNSANNSSSGKFRENVQNIISTLVKSGWRYNIHAVLAIKGDPSAWRNSRVLSEVPNTVLFNQSEHADQFENSFYLKEMLRNISSDGEDETMAVLAGKNRTYSKIRPIIYKLSDAQEMGIMENLVRGE